MDATVGMIITPITRPAASTLNAPVGSSNHSRNTVAWTNCSAKNPYTTVGTPASISRSGLSTLRTFGFAYSERRMAAPSPKGTATTSAIPVVHRVAVTSGSTPKDASANRGAHRVPKRNSHTGTSAKNESAGVNSAIKIPTVVRTVAIAATRKIALMMVSPCRGLPAKWLEGRGPEAILGPPTFSVTDVMTTDRVRSERRRLSRATRAPPGQS